MVVLVQASVAVPAVASANNHAEVEVREVPSLRALGKVRCNVDQGVSCLCWSPHGQLGVGGRCPPNKVGTAYMVALDVESDSKELPKPIGTHQEAVMSMYFVDDNTVLSAGFDGQIKLSDTRIRSTVACMNKAASESENRQVQAATSSEVQLTGENDANERQRASKEQSNADPKGNAASLFPQEDDDEGEPCICARPVGQPHFIAAAFTDSVRLFDMRMNRDVPLLKLCLPEYAGELAGMQTSGDGDTLVLNTLRSSELCFFDATQLLQCSWSRTITPRKVLRGHCNAANVQPALSPTGNTAACGSRDGSVCVWDVNTETLHKRISAHVSVVEDVSFLPAAGGAILVCSSTDGGLAALGAPLEERRHNDDTPPGAEVEPIVGERIKVRMAGGKSRESIVEGIVGDLPDSDKVFGPPERSCTIRVLRASSGSDEAEQRAHVPLAMIKKVERKEEQPLPARTTRSQAHGTAGGVADVPKKKERELEGWLGVLSKHAKVMGAPKPPQQNLPPPPAAELRNGPSMGSSSLVKQVTGSRSNSERPSFTSAAQSAAGTSQPALQQQQAQQQLSLTSQTPHQQQPASQPTGTANRSCSTGQQMHDVQALSQQSGDITVHKQQQQQRAQCHALPESNGLNKQEHDTKQAPTENDAMQPPAGNVVVREQWVQCDNKSCGKWRRLPASVSMDDLPSTWYCYMNHWRLDLASCDAPEEPDAHSSNAAHTMQYNSEQPASDQLKEALPQPAQAVDGPTASTDRNADAPLDVNGAAVGMSTDMSEQGNDMEDPELEG